MVNRNIQLGFFFGIFLLAIVVGFFIFKPYINILILALTFSVIFFPFYKKIARKKRNKFYDGVAAAITIVVILIMVLLPLSFLGTQVFFELQDVYEKIQDASRNETSLLVGIPDSKNPTIANLQIKARAFLTEIGNDPNRIFQGVYNWANENFGSLFGSVAAIARTILAFFLWLFALFYLLRDGERIQKIMVNASPLNDHYDNEIINRLARAIKSVIGGTLLIALVQGILTGVGFAIFGVPLPFIWGSLAVIVSLIPAIGVGLINAPAAIYLFATGNQVSGILLLIWGVGFVGTIDNIFRPILLERGTQIHPLVILFSVIGGISLFGPIGFITGPLVMTLISEFMKVYKQLVLQEKTSI